MNQPAAICTILILVLTGCVTFLGFRDPRFQARLIFNPTAILRDKEYYRLVTSGFLHADWIHFGFNAFSLYAFGQNVEAWFGVGTLLLIYFGSIVGGGLLSLYLHRHHEYRALGASGGVCGVIFASIFLLPGGGVMVFPLPIAIPSWLYAIVFLLGSFAALKRQVGNIGHDAHLGGAVVGLLITTALYPGIVRENPVLYPVVLGLALVLFGYLWLHPLYLPSRNLADLWQDLRSRTTRRDEPEDAEPDRQVVDQLLEKISRTGLGSLTRSERRQLERFSKERGNPRDRR